MRTDIDRATQALISVNLGSNIVQAERVASEFSTRIRSAKAFEAELKSQREEVERLREHLPNALDLTNSLTNTEVQATPLARISDAARGQLEAIRNKAK